MKDTYPGELDLLVYLGQLGQLVPQLVAGRVPVRPEKEGETLVGRGLLQLL